MASVTEQQVIEALSRVREPELGRSIVALGMVRDVKIDAGAIDFTIVLTTPACPLTEVMDRDAKVELRKLPGVQQVNIKWDSHVPEDARITGQLGGQFKNTVAVSSGKGGVGKTTVSVNLAVALAQAGATAGLLDADVYGPNVPIMLGVDRMPAPREGKIMPAYAHGLRVMSIGFMVPPDQPVIWRGPMIHSAIRQFLTDVDWGNPDYLIIDLPPGTGDAQLTLAQSVPLTGAIIVTTPQEVALADAVKGYATFEKLEVDILGIIENMGPYTDPQTGQTISFFGEGGGQRMAERLGVPFLGTIPLDPNVRVGGDSGKPIVAQQPAAPAAQMFKRIAKEVAAKISVLNLSE
ncbi:MAG TPA: Mrp/NBP35 family ATP-binding protein [Anaerolineae bacterium]|nr:Mrp/NBP35 family ATP-binding protein [Anaerolineae bacterium]